MNISPQKRLTWEPSFPLPFESIWSILVKVTILNNVTLEEITELIQPNWWLPYSPGEVDCSYTCWIDLKRFATLLNVRRERLAEGTWPGIGILPSKHGRGISRCPECWTVGYHCALFDVLEDRRCPWHKCRLTSQCKACLLPKTFKDRACRKCGMRFPTRDTFISEARSFSVSSAPAIAARCALLVTELNLYRTTYSKPAREVCPLPNPNKQRTKCEPYQRHISEREIAEAAAKYYATLRTR